MVDGRHRGNFVHRRAGGLPARRIGPLHRHPDQRSEPVRQPAAEDGGALPGGRIGARRAAAAGGPARGRCGRERRMSITFLIINLMLWVLVAALALTAAVRSKALFREGATEGARDFVMLLPRIMIGVVGSGY